MNSHKQIYRRFFPNINNQTLLMIFVETSGFLTVFTIHALARKELLF